MVKQEKKLIWLGLQRQSVDRSPAHTHIERLRENVGNYSTFQSDLDTVTSESDFDSYLQNNGFNEDQADAFITIINRDIEDSDSSGSSYDEFKDIVRNETGSYSELKTFFKTHPSFGTDLETTDGDRAAGIRTFEDDGITRDGINVPAGAVEVFGREVHFSQTGSVKTGDGTGSTGDDGTAGANLFTVSNFSNDASNNEVLPGEVVTFSADITNNGAYEEMFVATFIEDGTKIQSRTLRLNPGQTKPVSFDALKNNFTCHQYRISTTSEVEVCWKPAYLQSGSP